MSGVPARRHGSSPRPRAGTRPDSKNDSGSHPSASSWGWHRLEPDWARRLVAGADLTEFGTGLVLDLGAGQGAITAELLNVGVEVLAVEQHPGRVTHLRRRFAASLQTGQLRLLPIDLRTLTLPRRSFRVVANPPFALTTGLLRSLTDRSSGLRRADLVLQRAVVRRWATEQPMGRRFRAIDGGGFPRSAFRPRPPVDVSVLRLVRR